MGKQSKFKKLKVGMVACNINMFLNGKPDKPDEIEAVWEFFVLDMRRQVYCCSLTPSAELFRVGYDFTTTKEFDNLQDSDPEKWETKREELFEWINELHIGEVTDVMYMDWRSLSPKTLRGVSDRALLFMNAPKGKLMMICRTFDTIEMRPHLDEARDELSDDSSDDEVWDRAYILAINEMQEHMRSNSGIS